MSDQRQIIVEIISGQFASVLLIAIIMTAMLVGVWLIYKYTYPSVDDINKNELELFKIRLETEGDHNDPQTVQAFDRERFVTIRYIFDVQESCWSFFLQSSVSLFVVGVLAMLIILGVIGPDAGLPLIAAIGGAAIGRTGAIRASAQSSDTKCC